MDLLFDAVHFIKLSSSYQVIVCIPTGSVVACGSRAVGPSKPDGPEKGMAGMGRPKNFH